jgi:hypothetical protein
MGKVTRERSALGLLLTVALLLPEMAQANAATVKVGTKCSKVGVVKGSFVCKRVGGKLLWAKKKAPVRTTPTPKAASLVPGLVRAEYDGYFNDEPGWFESRKPTGSLTLVSEISFEGQRQDRFSHEYTGYVTADVDGLWTFRLTSDDAAYLWLGEKAVAGYDYRNALLALPGIHAPATAGVAVLLRKGERYALRLQYGDNTAFEKLQLAFRRPGGTQFSTDLTGLVVSTSPVSKVAFDPAFSHAAPVDPLAVDTATQFMERLISDSSTLAALNRTRVVMHVEPGANGKYPALSEEAVRFSIEWFANVLTPMTQSQINVILWRTEPWLEQKIRMYAPDAPAQIDFPNFPHNAALYPNPTVANIGTNLATVVGARPDTPRDVDISNLESPSYFAGQAHEAFHNWQASIQGWYSPETPVWFHEGMAQLFGFASMAKHSGQTDFYTRAVPKLLDPDGYSRTYCTSRVKDFNHFCSYFQGMYVSQYFLYRFGVPAYVALLRGPAKGEGFAANFRSATGVSYEDFCDEADRYLETIGWSG